MKRINQMEPWLGHEEKAAVMKYLDSGGWLTEYKKTEEFEEAFKKYVGCRFASANVNGTLSLVAALLTLNLEKREEVIVPNYTMISSANAVMLAGGTPLLVDIDPSNLCVDLGRVEEAVTPKTRALIYVSINGRCHSMDKVLDLVQRHDLVLIEDASQSLGSCNGGRHLGTFGNMGTFSFSPPKIITTGQGGMVITDDENVYRRLEMIKDYGRPKSGVDYYEIIGYNFKFTDLQAVIGLEQMKKLPWRVERKKEIYKLYQNELNGLDEVKFIETKIRDTPPWFVDVFVNKKVRQDFIMHLDKENVGARPFYPPIHTQLPYQNIIGSFENSIEISEKGLWLPSSSFLTDEQIILVCNKIKHFF